MTGLRRAFFICAIATSPLQAQSLVTHASTPSYQPQLNGGLMHSSTALSGSGAKIEIERTALTAGMDKRINSDLSLFGGAGLIAASQVSFLDQYGSGHLLFGGAAFDIYRQKTLSLSGTLAALHSRERTEFDVEGESASLDVITNELHLGAQAVWQWTKKFAPFLSASLVPYSATEVVTTAASLSGSDNLERTNIFLSSLGVSVRSGRLTLKPALLISGDKGFQMVASYRL